jgi:hypothetical protein
MTNLSSPRSVFGGLAHDSSVCAAKDNNPQHGHQLNNHCVFKEPFMKAHASFFAASALVMLAAAPAVFAQEATPDTWISASQSTLTRAEVRAQAITARDAGLLARGEASVEPLQSPQQRKANELAQGKTRTQVLAETAEARRLGLLSNRGEGSDVPEITPAQAEQIRVAGLHARDAEQRMLAQAPGRTLVR